MYCRVCPCFPLALVLAFAGPEGASQQAWSLAGGPREDHSHDTECFQLEVKYAEYYRHLEGGYYRLPRGEGCQGRPAWRRSVQHLSPHIEHLYLYSPPEAVGWVISHVKCDSRAFAQTAIESREPYVTSGRWREAVGGRWPQEYSTIQVKCAVYDRDCEVGGWGEWGPCSLPCGPGVRWRSRDQIVPLQGLGESCPPLHGSQECLGRVACPVGWGPEGPLAEQPLTTSLPPGHLGDYRPGGRGDRPQQDAEGKAASPGRQKYDPINPANLTVELKEPRAGGQGRDPSLWGQGGERDPSPRTDRVESPGLPSSSPSLYHKPGYHSGWLLSWLLECPGHMTVLSFLILLSRMTDER